jgi:general secretion pathway protein E
MQLPLISPEQLIRALWRQGKLTREEFDLLQTKAFETLGQLKAFFKEHDQLSPGHLDEVIASEFGLAFYTESLFEQSFTGKIAERAIHYMKARQMVPLGLAGRKLCVGLSDLSLLSQLSHLAFLAEMPIEPIYIRGPALDTLYQEYFKKGSGSQKSKEAKQAYAQNYEDANEGPVKELVEKILVKAVEIAASDIHFEPKENGLVIRFRIDGILFEQAFATEGYEDQVLTRLKVMANLDIAEHRLPQDGRMTLSLGEHTVDFRISVIPTQEGRRIVLRILSAKTLQSLSELGMSEKMRKSFFKLLQKPEGIFLVTGPTGSGKTTTLYAGLEQLDSVSQNIMTVEDPVEYYLEGISQMAVRPNIGLTFAQGLRHLLRQDPDVMMIGEIRDTETAKIAIQSALTGHLVLSTLHTNDAPSAITRLIDMGVESYLLSSCISGVLAQRLVRKICSKCKKSYEPSEQELKDLGLRDVKELYRGEGCSECHHSGYSGRLAIFELLIIDDAFRRQITRSGDAQKLKEVAIAGGLVTLKEAGARLACEGKTTIYEVMRVTS